MTLTPIPAEPQFTIFSATASNISPVSALEVSRLETREGDANLRNDMQNGAALA